MEASQPIPLNAENILLISEMMQKDSRLTFIEASSRLENTLKYQGKSELHSDVVTEEPDNTQGDLKSNKDWDGLVFGGQTIATDAHDTEPPQTEPKKKTTKSSAYSEWKFSQSKDDQLRAEREKYLKSGKSRAKKKYDSHK